MKTLLKLAAKPLTAVIVKGNPKFVRNNPKADAFYNSIKKHLESKGFSVTLDQGREYTRPEKANLWIGHSRGVDRLRFAPAMTRTLSFGSGVKGAINHPQDVVSPKGKPGKFPKPNQYHYIFTPEMKSAIDRVHQQLAK